jgi:UPF0176 protein
MESKSGYIVILFYKFTHIADPAALVQAHKDKGKELGLTGRMIVAGEGVNGTFEGTVQAIQAYKDFLYSDPRFADVLVKESEGNGRGFTRLTIKARDEVVTLGKPGINLVSETAPELPADELEKWYEENRDFAVLDLRNDYEIEVGQFDKTINPKLGNFRELPEKLNELKDFKDKKVVIVCTGGIRCEKAGCLLKQEGFSDVHQLKDGIHTYMQKHPGKHFKGTLFVFDNRMTTDVVETPNKEVIGRCVFCNTPTENFCSDDNYRPSKKILCCQGCFTHNAESGKLRLSTT